MRVVLFGGAGFIGRQLCAELAAGGHEIAVATRDRESARRNLILLPKTDVVACDYNRAATVHPILEGADAAVNLTGILHERKRGDFERVHCEIPRMLVAGCAAHKVRRFLQVSALGASLAAPSEYLRSRAKGEQIAREEAGVGVTVIRFPVVFGGGDSFATMFARLARLFPVLLLPCAEAVMQPIAVGDAAAFLRLVLEKPESDGKTLSAGGPEVLQLAQIVEQVLAAAGAERKVIPLGPGASRLVGAAADLVPFVQPPISADNCLSATVPGVCPRGGNDAAQMLGEMTTLRAGLATMFAPAPGA